MLLKDLEDMDNIMDFKEHMVLLGCHSTFCEYLGVGLSDL